MSKVRFISDLHIGHKLIVSMAEHRGGITSVDEHDQWLIEQWNSVTSKHDVVIVLGDVCFDMKKLHLIKKMKGSKHLLLGNHDKESANKYLTVFDKIIGFQKYKGMAWLSHAPIHHGSLRGKFNIHGHVHHREVQDWRYIAVCVEQLQGKPILWEDLVIMMNERTLANESR